MEEKTQFLPVWASRGALPLMTKDRSPVARGFREALFSKAFRVVPGLIYNRVSYEMRGEGPLRKVTFYEVILSPETEWATLRDEVYPSLARYLKAKGVNLQTPAGYVVSLFSEDHFYLIEAGEFMKAYCDIERIDAVAFKELLLQWARG